MPTTPIENETLTVVVESPSTQPEKSTRDHGKENIDKLKKRFGGIMRFLKGAGEYSAAMLSAEGRKAVKEDTDAVGTAVAETGKALMMEASGWIQKKAEAGSRAAVNAANEAKDLVDVAVAMSKDVGALAGAKAKDTMVRTGAAMGEFTDNLVTNAKAGVLEAVGERQTQKAEEQLEERSKRAGFLGEVVKAAGERKMGKLEKVAGFFHRLAEKHSEAASRSVEKNLHLLDAAWVMREEAKARQEQRQGRVAASAQKLEDATQFPRTGQAVNINI